MSDISKLLQISPKKKDVHVLVVKVVSKWFCYEN